MASVATAPASRQQLACCSGRALPAPRPFAPLAAAQRGRRRAPQGVRAAAAADDATGSERRQPVKRFDFTYLSPEEAAAAEAESQAAWEQGMKEYAELQEWLLFRTWRFGLLFSGYLLLAASGEAAFCELIGAAAGYGYLKWLIADVSKYQAGDRIPMREAENTEPALARGAAKVLAAYRQALLQPRLLVLPGLLAAVAAYNSVAAPEDQLGLVEQGCMVGGFLSWKIALALKIYEDLKPKPLSAEELMRLQRPMLVEVEDVKLDLREIARKKADHEAQQQQQEQQQQQAVAAEGQQPEMQRQQQQP